MFAGVSFNADIRLKGFFPAHCPRGWMGWLSYEAGASGWGASPHLPRPPQWQHRYSRCLTSKPVFHRFRGFCCGQHSMRVTPPRYPLLWDGEGEGKKCLHTPVTAWIPALVIQGNATARSLRLPGCQECFNQPIQLFVQGSVVFPLLGPALSKAFLHFSTKFLHILLLSGFTRLQVGPEFVNPLALFVNPFTLLVNPLALQTQDQPQHCQEDTWRKPLTEFRRQGRHGYPMDWQSFYRACGGCRALAGKCCPAPAP